MNKKVILIVASGIITLCVFTGINILVSDYLCNKQNRMKTEILRELRVSDADFDMLQSIYGLFIEIDEEGRVYTGRSLKDGKEYEIKYDCKNNKEILKRLIPKEQLDREDAQMKAYEKKHRIKYKSKVIGNLTYATTDDGRIYIFGKNSNQQ